MNVFETMASTQMLMFLYLATGMVLSKMGIITKEGRAGMLSLLICVVMPCSILNPYLEGLTMEMMKQGIAAMAVSFCGCLLSRYLGAFLWRKMPEGRREVLTYGTMLPNFGNAGLPVTQLVFGQQGVFITSMQMIPSTIIGWTVGPAIYHKKADNIEEIIRVLKNPNIVAVLLGIVILLTKMPVPSVICRAVTGFSGMTAPLSMVLIGAALSEVPVKEVAKKEVLLFCGVRLLIIPLTMLAALKLLHASQLLCQVSMVLFAMPVANYVAIQAELYGGDHRFASALVFLTTLLSLVTVPLLTLLL